MRATIAIFLLTSLSQCMAKPVAQESAFLDMFPAIPRVTEKPTDGAVMPTDAPAEDNMQTPDAFLLDALLHWNQEVFYQGVTGWLKANKKTDVPLNAFRWTFREYNKLSERILSLCEILNTLIAKNKNGSTEFIPYGPPGEDEPY